MLDKIKIIIDIFIKLSDEYFEKKACGGIDLNLLESNISNALYIDECTKLNLDYKFIGPVLAISNDRKQFLHWELWTDLDSRPLGEICGDKGVCRDILHAAHITQPAGQLFETTDHTNATNYALALNKPCVIKPARGTSSGNGVFVNLNNNKDIEHAIKKVSLFNAGIIIEEFISGTDFRALIHKGKCLSIIKRKKAQVTGNGKDSIKRLIEIENMNRVSSEIWNIDSPCYMKIRHDKKAKSILNTQNFNFNTILEAGETAWLSDICNYAFGTTYTELLDITHHNIIITAEKSAAAIGVNLAGVDIIAKDITKGDCYINEVNTTPSLEIHYFVENKEACKAPINSILKEYFSLS